MTSQTDLNFAVPFASDIQPSTTFLVPGGTETPASHTGQSITSGSNVITGTAGWTSGITAGQRVQVAYKVNDHTGDLDQGGIPNNNWKRAFPIQGCFVGVVASTTITVVDASNVAVNASYTYNNASPPSNVGANPLTVNTWNFNTVDPAVANDCLCRYGDWIGYAHSAPVAGRVEFQQQNFTSFNVKGVADDNLNGTGETNAAIAPGDVLYFDNRDVKDDIAGFGRGYLSKKRWGNYQAAVSCSVVDSGATAYVGAWFTFPAKPGGIQTSDPRNPYNETVLTSTTTKIQNNGQVSAVTVTGTYAGNVLKSQGAPTISDATTVGRLLTVINRDTTVTVRVYDEASTHLSSELGTTVLTNLRLQAGHRDLAPGGSITLVFSKTEAGTTYWSEIAYAASGGGAAATVNFDSPITFLSGGADGNPFSPNGFLSLRSNINLGSSPSLSNFLRYDPTITFQYGSGSNTHNVLAITDNWIADTSVANPATLGNMYAMVDSRQFVSRGVNVVGAVPEQVEVTTAGNFIHGIWHDRTYFGDLGGQFSSGQTIGDVGERFNLVLKGQASLGTRYGSWYQDITLTPVTYAGATLAVTACQTNAGVAQLQASPGSTASGRVTGFPFADADLGKTITHSGLTGTVTIIGFFLPDGLGNYQGVNLDTNASGSVLSATATIHDPSVTYTPTAPTQQTAIHIDPLVNAGAGDDNTNRGIDTSAASFFGGNVYGGVGAIPSTALWSILNTGAAQFGLPGAAGTDFVTAVGTSNNFLRVVRDTGAAATTAGQALTGIIFQGTKGTTGASADWTTAATITAENDSNAAWSSGVVPGRMLLRTQPSAGGGTNVVIALDHQGGIHFGHYSTTSNVISQSYVAIDNNGKMWWGPTAYTSGMPSAAPATISTTGAITGLSLSLSGSTLTGWGTPTSTFLRTTFSTTTLITNGTHQTVTSGGTANCTAANVTTAINALADTCASSASVTLLTERVGALISDLVTMGILHS